MNAKQKIIIAVVCIALLIGISLGLYFHNKSNNVSSMTNNETSDVIIETEDIKTEEPIETEIVQEETTVPDVETTPAPDTKETQAIETIPSPQPEPEPEPTVQGYVIPVTQSDIDMMAKLVYLEARGESYSGQVAVAEVVINRVLSRSFPNTVSGVVYQRGQFTPAYSIPYTTATQTQYNAVYDALNGNGVLNNHRVVYFAMGSSCGSYYTTIGNHVFGCE